jgi:hypothetical protein
VVCSGQRAELKELKVELLISKTVTETPMEAWVHATIMLTHVQESVLSNARSVLEHYYVPAKV